MLNFTLRDILGSLLAIGIFPIVLLIPGYLLARLLNLFDFRQRTQPVRYAIGVALSNTVVPIYVYLLYRFVSGRFVLITLLLYGVIFILVDILPLLRGQGSGWSPISTEMRSYLIIFVVWAAIWIVFSILLLVDLQFSNKLYFPATSYDYTTRAAVIDAITRTGVPPINPSYFPGHAEHLTFLYYYWYILPSLIDQVGGPLITARQALIAGVTWAAFSLVAMIAVYMRIRNRLTGKNAWRSTLLGVQLLLISGVDFFPIVLLSIASRLTIGRILFPDGRIEGWNMPIMSWLNALTWVPNHVSATVSCFMAMLVILSSLQGTSKKRFIASLVAGLSIASAFGTSVWIALTLAVIWLAWGLLFFVSKENRRMIGYMLLAGLIAIALSIPFISGLLGSGNAPGGGLPIALYVRTFTIDAFLPITSQFGRSVINFLFLPANYFMELGFFLVVGLYWFKHRKDYEHPNHVFITAEIIALLTVTVLLSFVRSDIIDINDLGIRAWLIGQFILLIWATDVLYRWLEKDQPWLSSIYKSVMKQPKIGPAMRFLLTAGILMTTLEALTTRSWSILIDTNIVGFPNSLSPNTNLGRRSYAARLAYEYINHNLPESIITQNNPSVILDRPSGLYGERQMVIADRTAYGVPVNVFENFKEKVSMIFRLENRDWSEIDQICQQWQIDVLIVKDTDPLWKNLSTLMEQRRPLYRNEFYAIFACGRFSER